jgi:hypothetical protein
MSKKTVRRPSSPGTIPSAIQTPGPIVRAAMSKRSARTKCARDNRSHRTDGVQLWAIKSKPPRTAARNQDQTAGRGGRLGLSSLATMLQKRARGIRALFVSSRSLVWSAKYQTGTFAAPQGLCTMAAMVRPRKLNSDSKRPCALVFAPSRGTP